MQLLISGATVTTKYKPSIRFAATAPVLKEYIQHRNQWEDHTKIQIDWKAHGLALRRNQDQCLFTKLDHDILPTNSKTFQCGQYHKKTCNRCHQSTEDRDHIIRCIQAKTWRISTLQKLQSKCDTLNTNPVLQDILIAGVELWMMHQRIQYVNYPVQYHILIQEQDAIGWRQVFNGRLSQGWAYFQDRYLRLTNQQTKSRTGTQWTVNIIQTAWTKWKLVWHDRNENLHGATFLLTQQRKKAEALRQIRAIYQNKHLYLPEHRDFLHSNEAPHQQQPTLTLLAWLETYSPVFT